MERDLTRARHRGPTVSYNSFEPFGHLAALMAFSS